MQCAFWTLLFRHIKQVLKNDWKELIVLFSSTSILSLLALCMLDFTGLNYKNKFLWKAIADVGNGTFVVFLGLLAYWLGLIGVTMQNNSFTKEIKKVLIYIFEVLIAPLIGYTAMIIPPIFLIFYLNKTNIHEYLYTFTVLSVNLFALTGARYLFKNDKLIDNMVNMRKAERIIVILFLYSAGGMLTLIVFKVM